MKEGNAEDPTANAGIRLVYAVAEDVNYQNLLGLNVLTVRLSDGSFVKTAGETAGKAGGENR